MSDFVNETIESVHKALVQKEFSVTELTQRALDFTEKRDQDLNAFITLDKDGAIKQAEEIDNKGIDDDNILAGIPMGMKDNIVTKGLLTTSASKILSNFTPIYDATVVEKLKAQGVVILGKTNLDEFAMGGSTETSYYGVTKNAWDNTKVPGGSSGGSAASVASGEVLYSLGSDTGGSIRQPAAYNGIVGLKPTYGRVSRWGLIAFGSSLDQIGPLTRTVKDNALVLNAIAGVDNKDTTSANLEVPDYTKNIENGVANLRIAVPKEFLAEGIDPEVKNTINLAIEQFKSLGAIVEEVSIPHTKYGIAAYYILGSSEASSNLQRFDGVRYGFSDRTGKTLEEMYQNTRTEGFGEEVKRRIMLGTFALSAGFYDAYFKKAAQVRTILINDFNKIFENFDIIIGPTAPTPAFALGSENADPKTMYMNDVLTIPVNLAGLPGLSINAGFSSEHLPIGLQIIGKAFDEATVYKAAFAFERATQLFKQIPGGQK
ncbi:MAG: Asp-tRNA(Asn)/Glu-tRNA(Gln) amidotransferase subunit GatA [Lactobacillaceae bacterium]|jgi:aspartyl-tRNA(Asn)/glutamyl-tRNA(Gln) amidotransferase subunit A|nr:Asp-tRNA(Asn)/Glu-tRNA(Gln) amidotransferase subunit GatA [Lactobacillaceae bacterium]